MIAAWCSGPWGPEDEEGLEGQAQEVVKAGFRVLAIDHEGLACATMARCPPTARPRRSTCWLPCAICGRQVRRP